MSVSCSDVGMIFDQCNNLKLTARSFLNTDDEVFRTLNVSCLRITQLLAKLTMAAATAVEVMNTGVDMTGYMAGPQPVGPAGPPPPAVADVSIPELTNLLAGADAWAARRQVDQHI